MKRTTTRSHFTAHLYCQDELIAIQSSDQLPPLMMDLLSWMQELPDNARGMIIDNHRGVVVQRCECVHCMK